MIRMIGIDPSTGTKASAVGVVLVEFSDDPEDTSLPRLLGYQAFCAVDEGRKDDPQNGLWRRLRWLHGAVGSWVERMGIAVDLVAIELHRSKSNLSNEALAGANAAILMHPFFDGLQLMWIHATTAKKAATGSGAADKATVLEWAKTKYTTYNLDLDWVMMDQVHAEGIADALSVAVAGAERWRAAERANRAEAERRRKIKEEREAAKASRRGRAKR